MYLIKWQLDVETTEQIEVFTVVFTQKKTLNQSGKINSLDSNIILHVINNATCVV